MQVSEDHRVGLYFNRTSVPLFLMATSVDIGAAPICLTDISLIPAAISQSSELLDRTFVEFVRGFFAAGGS